LKYDYRKFKFESTSGISIYAFQREEPAKIK
jgi:hypothetical protein